MLNVVKPSVTFFNCYAECLLPNVVMLSAIMANTLMLSVVEPNVYTVIL
jgi:hypothetical protein